MAVQPDVSAGPMVRDAAFIAPRSSLIARLTER